MPTDPRVVAVVLRSLALCMAQAARPRAGTPRRQRRPASASGGETPSAERRRVAACACMTASRQRNYVGTFVVSAHGGSMSSARIWHACEGDLQIERVEALSGPPRSTFSRNDEVMTFLPETQRRAEREAREPRAVPEPAQVHPTPPSPTSTARACWASDRVAGFDADVVQLAPRTACASATAIWSEQRSGLVVKLQTLDAEGRVLEQAAFSELQLDAPVKATSPGADDEQHRGLARREVRARAHHGRGRRLGAAAARSPASSRSAATSARWAARRAAPEGTMQWIFSDGLASVSLFVEPYDAQRQPQEGLLALGATYTLTRRWRTRRRLVAHRRRRGAAADARSVCAKPCARALSRHWSRA